MTLCLIACKQRSKSVEGIFVDMDNPEKVSLFDIFHSIEIIPLETSPDVLIAGIGKIIVYQDSYFMLDPRQNIIFIFDHSGKYLSKIDKKGKGPGEYLSIADIFFNPFSNNLELLEPHGFIHVFDINDNYIETKRIVYPDFRAVHLFTIVDYNTYVFYQQFESTKIIYFDLDENKLLQKEFEENSRLGSYGVKSIYQFKDDLFFFRPIHPVVYKIGKNRLEAVFQFDFGKYTREGTTAIFSEEAINNWAKYKEEVFNQFPYVITKLMHNNKYVFASLLWKNASRKANIIYNKSTEKSKFILDFIERVEFNSDNITIPIITDDYILISCQWIDLEKYIKIDMLNGKQKEIFEKVTQAKMEQNPILIKYWFK